MINLNLLIKKSKIPSAEKAIPIIPQMLTSPFNPCVMHAYIPNIPTDIKVSIKKDNISHLTIFEDFVAFLIALSLNPDNNSFSE